MDKKRILEILEGAKDDNGEIPMSLVRKAFEKIEEPCEDAVSRQAVINIINKPVIIKAKEQIEALPSVQPEIPPYVAEIEAEYKKWINVPCIRKPLAKALYEVWKKHDMEDTEMRTDGRD